jgi:4-aminobutyrate aminotransferase-like enzyme/Ser/Thr protein kinase RdoA (MazF antagonist)/murein DD-endopeptidase MepM/ murein hydrolase activator NlpD
MVRETYIRPDLSRDRALSVARNRFGISVTETRPLPSDRDQNFLLTDTDSDRRYVLKVSHAAEDPEVLDFQNRMLEHLTRAGFPLANVLRSRDGEEIIPVPGKEDRTFLARLLTWVPGTQLYRVRPHRPVLLNSLGSFLGGMDRALEDFSHPAQDRMLRWDLKHANRVVHEHLDYVDDPRRKDILQRLTSDFLERLGPLVPDLRLSVIHGDANDHNVLVSALESGGEPDSRTVTGIVDFGDAVRSYTVGELAIAGAYVMLGKSDPFAAAAEVVQGYHRALPLGEAEIEAVLPLMGLRLCASVVISADQQRLEPDNGYLAVTETPAWELLDRFDQEILGVGTLLFRKACGLDPLPVAKSVTAWLEANGCEASPVVGRPSQEATKEPTSVVPLDLSTTPAHIFDFRPESEEFPQATEATDAQAWTRLIFDRMTDVGAEVGIGRYDEVRRWYTSEIFRTRGSDPPEWRTVHIGVDLFLPAGAPVLAPYEGVVHSVKNNVGDLDYGPTVILEHRASLPPGGSLKFWTLFGHLGEEPALSLYPGQPLAKGEAFATIGDFPSNGNWAPHLHFQLITDRLGLEGNFPGVAPPSQREIWKVLSPDPNTILRIPELASPREGPPGLSVFSDATAAPGRPTGASLSTVGGRTRDEIVAARRAHLGPTLSIAYDRPLKIVRGSGQFLYDDDGQAYLDCVNNVPHVGHNHPRVVQAGQRQMALLNTNTRYLHDLLVDYAERLVATLPEPLSVVYFVCTGSEANELALRLARTHTGHEDVVVVDGAYHGNTSALIDISPYKFDRPGGTGAPSWVHKTLMPDPFRGRFRTRIPGEEVGPGPTPSHSRGSVEYLPEDELGPRYADHIREILSGLKAEGREPAAFFCESMLGCGGQIVLPTEYMANAFQHVRDAGGVCIADEVQVGFGRAGTHFWAFDTQGVVPDVVTLGKPMANGHPMAAVVTTRQIADSFTTGMEYFNTFGGNPVSCAIGMAVLDVIEDEGLQENARRVGLRLLESLKELKERHEVVGDVRGLGLYLGLELVEDRATRKPAPKQAARAKERLKDHRLLLSTDGPDDNVLKIKPPLVFTEADADRLASVLDKVLGEDGIRL